MFLRNKIIDDYFPLLFNTCLAALATLINPASGIIPCTVTAGLFIYVQTQPRKPIVQRISQALVPYICFSFYSFF